ncbi:MAG TPA: response regulator transcription factor [Burkholderiales bacterium]|jgi:DNA-binding NarL/FixJ family response regulator|nr:response regulator transcription factor [Burkholderiales bacterium]
MSSNKCLGKTLKVYIVEDSPVLRDRVIESLEESGNSRIVGSAETEEDAVNGIIDSAPDAVVLDIQLREGNGLNVLRRLRNIDLEVRPLVIILTNYNYPEFRYRAMTAGTDYFFDKATELHRVAEIIGSLRNPVTVH